MSESENEHTGKLKYDFLLKHQNADEIVIHKASGLPTQAIYKSVFTKGEFKKLLDEHPLNDSTPAKPKVRE